MKRSFLISLIALFFARHTTGQCEALLPDTMSLPGAAPVSGDYLETTLKNESVVRIFKTDDDKLYLRLIVTKNFYFNKVDVLEIKSGTKSFYAKNTKQHKIDKTHGMFVTEIYRNYLATLREFGITGIAFGGADTDYTKQDAAQVKAIAQCVYASLPRAN